MFPNPPHILIELYRTYALISLVTECVDSESNNTLADTTSIERIPVTVVLNALISYWVMAKTRAYPLLEPASSVWV